MASTPSHSRRDPSRGLKSPDIVYTEGLWCCSALSSSAPSRRKDGSKSKNLQSFQGLAIMNKDMPISNKKVSGEITTLIKQGMANSGGQEKTGSTSPFRIRMSPGRVSPINDPSSNSSSDSVLNTSFLAPPSSPPVDKSRSSPTLFEMMVHEHEIQPKFPNQTQIDGVLVKQPSIQEKVLSVAMSPGNQFNDASSSDVKLALSNKDGVNISLDLHRHILASHSRFFAAKLSERWSKQQAQPFLVEISDCDDMELYVETIRLMYCRDLKRKLMKENVSKVLRMLKVSAAIVFEAGILSCLEHLEAVPWAEEDEELVASTLSQLQMETIGAGEVLKRVSTEDPNGLEEILIHLVTSVTRGSDEKARREMKNLVSRMLRENAAVGRDTIDLSKESLYRTCQTCLDILLHLFIQSSNSDFKMRESEERALLVAQMARQADNLLWLAEILIDRNIADDFVRLWACQTELATLHSQIPAMYRHEVSKITARIFIAVGKGQVLAPIDTRLALLQNWLQPLIDDFAWLQRGGRGLDRKVVEEGISQTILTLPLKNQQTIMLAWITQYLSNADDCPNLQKAFEIWWRRTFVRPYLEGDGRIEVSSL